MENLANPPAGRRYILMYRARNFNGIRRVFPRNKKRCCPACNTWRDPCIAHPIRLECETCEFVKRTSISLRRCPELTRPPAMTPANGVPATFHRHVFCSTCNTEGTVRVLRVGEEALNGDDAAKACLEVQVLGPFQVTSMETFSQMALNFPCKDFSCEGPSGKTYQGKLMKDSNENGDGHSIKFGRLKVDGVSLQVNGIEGFWREAPWRACGIYERRFGLTGTTNFTVTIAQWPPTDDQIDAYREETTMAVCMNEWADEGFDQLI